MPRHKSTTKPVAASDTRKRVLVNNTTTARHGGNLARVDFHVTPPLGSNIVDEIAGKSDKETKIKARFLLPSFVGLFVCAFSRISVVYVSLFWMMWTCPPN
jgi:hypothetical protein